MHLGVFKGRHYPHRHNVDAKAVFILNTITSREEGGATVPGTAILRCIKS